MNKPLPTVLVLAGALVLFGAALRSDGAALVGNGNFEGGFYPDTIPMSFLDDPTDGDLVPVCWRKWENFTGYGDEESLIRPANDNGPSGPGYSAVEWIRSNGSGSGDWTMIRKPIGVDITDCSAVTLGIDIKAISHNLGTSGWTAEDWEYPVFVKVLFTDTTGVARYWQHGWGIFTTDPTDPVPVDKKVALDTGIVSGDVVEANTWKAYSFDLLVELAKLAQPKTIDEIQVGGSGWDFHGMADNVRLDVACVDPDAPVQSVLKTLECKLDALEAKSDVAADQGTGLGRKIDALEAKSDADAHALAALEAKVDGTGGSLGTLAEKLDKLTRAVAALETKLDLIGEQMKLKKPNKKNLTGSEEWPE